MYIESEKLELKSEVTKNLNKEIIALANTKGGIIYIGYNDDSTLIGVENAKEELDRISNIISDTIEPTLIFNIKMVIVKDKGLDIIKIEVLKGINRPYYLKSKGMTSEGVYLRLGATNRQATRDEIKTMIKEDDEYSFEYVRSNKQELTFETIKKEFVNKKIDFNKTKMSNLGIIDDKGEYTNLAYMISDQNLYSIKIAVYKGNEKVEFLDRKELESGSVFKQLHEVLEYLNLTIKIAGKIVGFERIDKPEYNIEILRECLINCIIHKNYDMNSSIMINIYQDNIEFVNVGGLVGGLTIEDIKNGSSAQRNPKLASLFHRLNYVESYGSGIPRVMASYKMQENKPIISVAPNSFSIKLPKIVYSEEIEMIINIIESKGKISREDIEKSFNFGKTKAVEVLNKYVKDNILRKVSIGNKTFYELF